MTNNKTRRKMFFKSFLLFSLILLCVDKCTSLECYVCHRQEDNVEKCLNTIKTCEQEEDVCMTEVEWGSTPYWSQGALKQYYVSKRCSTKDKCKNLRKANMPLCTHIWYEDWKCSSCCQGDRCNYYIISGSSQFSISFIMLPLSFTVSLLYLKNRLF